MGISQEDIDNIVKDPAGEGTAQDAKKDDAEVATRRKILEGFASHLSNIFATLTGGDVKVGFQSDDLAAGSEIGSALPGDWFGFVVHLEVGGEDNGSGPARNPGGSTCRRPQGSGGQPDGGLGYRAR